MAKKNARYHKVEDRCEFVEGDVTNDILQGEYDAILSFLLGDKADGYLSEIKSEL